MNVLALDLSLSATGVCADGHGLTTLRCKKTGTERLAWFESQVREIVTNYTFHVVAIEDVVVRSPAAAHIGMLHGVVRVLLHFYEMPTVLIPPASLKKYATGKGNATKPDMRMALYKRDGLDLNDDNQVDAVWLRHMALDHYGYATLDMPAAQRACMDKVDWPELVPL